MSKDHKENRDTVATTVYMDRALVRRARYTVAYYPGLTLSGLFEAAIEREVDWRERRDNGGEQYPEPDGRPVRRGRPLKKV
jgi:post-segregation antitoxin (ccd killing protein)